MLGPVLRRQRLRDGFPHAALTELYGIARSMISRRLHHQQD
ncbi:hypothetical protein ABT083_07280 [Streptomyces goshikiensis]